jgi:hypothetical protein
MHRRIGWLVVAILTLALFVVTAAAATDREKGPKEKAAEAKIAADHKAPQLIGYAKLGKKEARDAGVAEEIVAYLPFETQPLPLVPGRLEGAPTTRTLQSRSRIASWAGCWRATWRRGGGTWPYHRDVFQETTWCTTMQNTVGAYYGRSWPHADYGCAPNYGPTYQRVGGGIGYSSVDIETRGGFACDVYWYVVQTWVWMVPRYYGNGQTAMAGWGQ